MSLRLGDKIISGVIPDTSAFATKTELKNSIETKITNCITEIPQDIKLELNNGTLTLKAGSKYYVPNGVGNFYVVVTSRDITIQGWSNSKGVVIMQSDGNGYAFTSLSQCYSGPSQPVVSGGNTWYDTSSNMVKRCNDGQTFVGPYSLPICIVTSSGASQQVSTIASIDQIFNGFGYIGSTVFALPGVKGLIPNGRNEDGSLKNTEFTTNRVITRTDSGTHSGEMVINTEGDFSIGQNTSYPYDEANNFLYNSGVKYTTRCVVAKYERIDGIYKSFTPKTTFHSLDYNDLNNMDYVVESYRNGATWYRLYKSGWVEQGGDIGTNSTINLLKTMLNENYYVNVTWDGGKSANFYPSDALVRNRTRTSFYTTMTRSSINVQGICWEVKGQGA